MPRDKDRKRIIRIRMKKTGESYTAARAQIISKAQTNRPAARSVDLGALAGMRDEVIAARTGRNWHEWVRVLDADNAAAMPHRELAALVHGKHQVPEWWTQAVAVGYERIKGLRERGQLRSGFYEVSKSRTVKAPIATLFDAWANEKTRRRWLDGVAPMVRTATSKKSMRLQWPDGTIVVVGFVAKSPEKSMVSVQHMKLRDRAASDRAKKFWTAQLDTLASLVAERGV